MVRWIGWNVGQQYHVVLETRISMSQVVMFGVHLYLNIIKTLSLCYLRYTVMFCNNSFDMNSALLGLMYYIARCQWAPPQMTRTIVRPKSGHFHSFATIGYQVVLRKY